MKYLNKKKKKNPLVPVLSVVVAVLAVILLALLLLKPAGDDQTTPTTEPAETGMEATAGEETTEANAAQEDDQTQTQAPEQTDPMVETTEAPESTDAVEPDDQQDPTTPAIPETTEPLVEDVRIETPYCPLYFPGQWSEGLKTEIKEEDWVASVTFYGNVGGEDVLLFTLYFGGASGYPVGIFQTEDGMMLDVTMENNDFELKDSWSAGEADRICAMQEALNYVLEKLSEEDGFTSVEP